LDWRQPSLVASNLFRQHVARNSVSARAIDAAIILRGGTLAKDAVKLERGELHVWFARLDRTSGRFDPDAPAMNLSSIRIGADWLIWPANRV